ncbi:Uncharacterised protein [Vibrio cholerae]|nr:Uncharacterised protein [Vibrio cholerae]CSI10930.1 Uncharacterised protein [Vibrio cholerae]
MDCNANEYCGSLSETYLSLKKQHEHFHYEFFHPAIVFQRMLATNRSTILYRPLFVSFANGLLNYGRSNPLAYLKRF